MIKNFDTYIAEGRMGRLIDAAKAEEIRKEDVLRIKTYEDIVDYCLSKYDTTTLESFYTVYSQLSGNIYLDFSKHDTVALCPEQNSGVLSFKYIGLSYHLCELLINKHSFYDFTITTDYIFDVIGVDNNIYQVSNYEFGSKPYNYCEISRKDGHNMEPLEALTEIYDKLVSDEDSEICTVRKKNRK